MNFYRRDEMDFSGQTALVTGGSSGIGLALARQLASQGARVVVVARDQQRLEEAIASLRATKDGAHLAISTDVSDAGQVAQMAEQVIEQAGVPNLLINNAGVAHPGYVQALDLEIYHWMMDVNYYGAVHVTKAFLPGMLARRSGHVVNIASTAGFAGVFGYTAYCGSKFALRGFNDALRAELKPHCLHVSIVYPSDTDTPQLVYDNLHKPPELVEMVATLNMNPYPAEVVAGRILKGISKKKQVIITDAGNRALYIIVHNLNMAYSVQDFLLNRALKKLHKQQQCAE